MKWSEQMRVLLSEDEHYNQLIYDKNALYINDKLIATLNENETLDPNKFWDLKKKYPYIDDKNFLLNCLFKLELERVTNGSAESGGTSTFVTGYFHPSYVEYNKSNMSSYITVVLLVRDTVYRFSLITEDNEI